VIDLGVYSRFAAKSIACGKADTKAVIRGSQNRGRYRWLELLDQQGGKSGKYNVTVTGSQGVQIGDRGSQTNTFTS